MPQFEITNINNSAELIAKAAHWFSQKWRIPEEAYQESMTEALQSKTGVPAWYVILDADNTIIAGLGIIDNDFHERKDLTPNICAVFVEESYRGKGLARKLLNHACDELAKHDVTTCYLITDHTSFYERCGWEFYDMIKEDSGSFARCYQHTIQD